MRGGRQVMAKGEINGVHGIFIIDTGASYVALKRAFAERAEISMAGESAMIFLTRPVSRSDRVQSAKLGRYCEAVSPITTWIARQRK